MMRMLGRIARTAHQECYAVLLLVGILLQSLYLTEMYILSCLCCSGVL